MSARCSSLLLYVLIGALASTHTVFLVMRAGKTTLYSVHGLMLLCVCVHVTLPYAVEMSVTIYIVVAAASVMFSANITNLRHLCAALSQRSVSLCIHIGLLVSMLAFECSSVVCQCCAAVAATLLRVST
jgi:hypothetical protein